MSSASHFIVTQAKETKINKGHSSFNLEITPCDESSDLLYSSTPTTNRNYLYYVNAEPTRKRSVQITHNLTPTSSIKESSLNIRRKLSAISLPVPWHKRNRSSSDDKTSTGSISKESKQQSQHRRSHIFRKMSRDRLLTLDRLFSSGTHTTTTTNDDEPASPITEFTALNESTRSSEKPIKSIKENGYLRNSPRLMTRLQCTTKGTKALRLLGDDGVTNDCNQNKDQAYHTKDFILNKNTARTPNQRRLLLKNGEVNISRFNIEKRRRQYLADIFTTLIDLKWRYTLCLFTLGFCLSWLAFALIWYLLMHIYGDLHPDNYNSANYSVCIAGVHSFAGAILFSIETQQTIGYGTRVVKETCYFAIVVIMVQSSIGVLLQSFMVGVVFAKISRPKKRTETLIWSREAVICLRDGQMTLQCRVGDMRKSHIVEAHVRMYLIKKRVTLEGEILPLHTYDMNVGFDKGVDRLFLIWPLVVEHIIDEQSPLYGISRSDLAKQRFELVVILEGIIESTGMTTQARTSYLPSEILWGYRFERLITFQRDDGLYRIDYSRFNLTYPVDMITCSAKDLKELHELEKWHENYQHYSYEKLDMSVSIPNTATTITTTSPFVWQEKRESTL
ncbi:unnamed protein product [Rotaria sordida]|uniref:G protein-activated inward rectifier potassium channel 3 n=1 Tax=Rotaria sordida TaxID=392033 RepID=A0A819JPN2_9BILA|nr:unnamed protein product [Rotaria sordida]CAF1267094.1 unnamed protein product [Rotaria sordida]CAF3797948.1 unnamed protein product [Rotaria sordida]CAF3899681.1 unnamed protein product [Rotaria sordida]CAF3936397.1 unnamed protein product [Rotaria sordida]